MQPDSSCRAVVQSIAVFFSRLGTVTKVRLGPDTHGLRRAWAEFETAEQAKLALQYNNQVRAPYQRPATHLPASALALRAAVNLPWCAHRCRVSGPGHPRQTTEGASKPACNERQLVHACRCWAARRCGWSPPSRRSTTAACRRRRSGGPPPGRTATGKWVVQVRAASCHACRHHEAQKSSTALQPCLAVA